MQLTRTIYLGLMRALLISSALLAVNVACAATVPGGRQLMQAAPIVAGEDLSEKVQ